MKTNSIRKPFSRALYNKADGKAKNIIRAYLESQGHKLKRDEEKYYCDVEGEDGHGWEVEIKYAWSKEWPDNWKDVRIPHRKKRLLDKKGEDNITFYILNSICSQAWEIPGTVVANADVVEVPNKFVPNGELFFSILVSDVKKIFLTDVNEYDTVQKS